MNTKLTVRRFLAGSIIPVLIGLPIPTAAATSPQQALNDALKNEMTREAGRMDATGKVDVEYRPFKRGEPIGKGSMAMRMQARTLPIPEGEKRTLRNLQSEGRLVLESMNFQNLPDMDASPVIEEPLAVGWKLANGDAYARVERFPQALIDTASGELDMDLNLILGRWIKFDMGEDALDEVIAERGTDGDLLKMLVSGDAGREMRLKTFLAFNPILQVTRVEKRMKNAAGEDIARMRLRVNPAFVNLLYREALRDLPKSGVERTTRLRELNAEFAKLRLNLSRTAMVANVNMAKKRFERFEMGGRYPETVKNCTYDANGKERCTNTGTRIVTVAIGISLSQEAGSPVEIPLDVLTPEQAAELLFPPRSYDELDLYDEEMISEDDMQTLWAP